VAKDHGKTLKPAHLSYKCTVCTATFGQYKLFENHVYTAHSGVAKKADKAKQASIFEAFKTFFCLRFFFMFKKILLFICSVHF
jgi:hypothetical protein